MDIKCNSKIKHFHYLIGKFCIDNNIPIFSKTWDRISTWENNFESTENQIYPYLGISCDELGGYKNVDEGGGEVFNFDEFLLRLKNYKLYGKFRDWKVEKIDNKFIFGCGEVKLTKDEIKSFDKIYRILIDKKIILNENDLEYISNLIND